MSSLEELEARLTALETRVAQEADLRAHVDRDQADLVETVKATNHVVQALHITQQQHTRKIEDLIERIESLRAEMTARFDQVSGGLDHIASMMTTLINREEG